MRAVPSHLRIGDLIFVHAGLNPVQDDAKHLDRHRPIDDPHWAEICNRFLTWEGGWDVDPTSGAQWMGPTVLVHGHTPAIRTSLSETYAEMAQMVGVVEYRAICLDAEAASLPQVGWARFWV